MKSLEKTSRNPWKPQFSEEHAPRPSYKSCGGFAANSSHTHTLGRSRNDPHPPHGGNLRSSEGGSKIYFGRPKGARGKWGYNLSKGLKLLCFYKKSFPDLEEPSLWLRASDGVMQHVEFIASTAERLYNNSDHLLVLKKWIFVCPLPHRHRPSYDRECCTHVQRSGWISSQLKSSLARFYFLKVNWYVNIISL